MTEPTFATVTTLEEALDYVVGCPFCGSARIIETPRGPYRWCCDGECGETFDVGVTLREMIERRAVRSREVLLIESDPEPIRGELVQHRCALPECGGPLWSRMHTPTDSVLICGNCGQLWRIEAKPDATLERVER